MKEEKTMSFIETFRSMLFKGKSEGEQVSFKSPVGIKESYEWSDDYISDKNFEIVLGEGLIDKVTLNFNDTPHLLISGDTGTGKSVLEKCISWQILNKGAEAYFIDLKGGVELNIFKNYGEVICERKRVSQLLENLVKKQHESIEKFRALDAKNLDEYNCKVGGNEEITRTFLIIDELAELIDTIGLSKEEKAICETIEKNLDILIRISRVTGINMLFATQRLDIKSKFLNNISAKIQGRTFYGSEEAARLPNLRGRFLLSHEGKETEFQAYNFKDEDIKNKIKKES